MQHRITWQLLTLACLLSNMVNGIAASPSFQQVTNIVSSNLNATNLFGTLVAPGSVTTVNWNNQILNDSGGTLAANWNSRTLNGSAGTPAVNWGNDQLIEPGGSVVINWSLMNMYDNLGRSSINWSTRMLDDTLSTGSVDWANRKLLNTGGSQNLDWGNKLAIGNDGTPTVDWAANILRMKNMAIVIDWQNLATYGSWSVSAATNTAIYSLPVTPLAMGTKFTNTFGGRITVSTYLIFNDAATGSAMFNYQQGIIGATSLNLSLNPLAGLTLAAFSKTNDTPFISVMGTNEWILFTDQSGTGASVIINTNQIHL